MLKHLQELLTRVSALFPLLVNVNRHVEPSGRLSLAQAAKPPQLGTL
jgi:hypothetical protein